MIFGKQQHPSEPLISQLQNRDDNYSYQNGHEDQTK